MLKYIVNDQPYKVNPEDKEEFEQKYPDFELVEDEESNTTLEGGVHRFQVGGKHGDIYAVKPEDLEEFKLKFGSKAYEPPKIEHADEKGFLEASQSLFKQEDKVVEYLNEQYKGQGVKFAFGEGDFQDTIEVLVGDQKEGEGEKFNLDFDDEDNLRIFQNIKTHIDNYTKPDTYGWTQAMQEQWPEMQSQIEGVLDENFVEVRDDFIRGKQDSTENVKKELNILLEGLTDERGREWEVSSGLKWSEDKSLSK